METSSNFASTSEETLLLERNAASSLVYRGAAYVHPRADSPIVVDVIDGLTIVFATLPWWEVPPLLTFPRGSRGLCYLPFQGWKNGVWHDGPLVRLNASGDVMACVAKGGSARLEVPVESNAGVGFAACAAWFDEREGEAAKISLTEALRAHCGVLAQAALALSRLDAQEAVLCALMRRAYPEAVLVAHDSPSTPPWRRLLQNLGILHGRAPLPSGPLDSVTLAPLRDLLPEDRLACILQALQRPSDLIPPRLLDEAKISPTPWYAQDSAKGG